MVSPYQYKFPDAVIQVFCKAPIAGQVKTRLMPQLTAAQAAAVHIQLTIRTLNLASNLKLCPVQLWCAPAIQHPFFINAAKVYSLKLHPQANGDLGERMHAALIAGLEQFKFAVLIGCDCPSFTADDLVRAVTLLKNDTDVVLAPTEDGGYSLIGLKSPQPALFQDISWSSSAVMAQTRAKLVALALQYKELNTHWDVDNYADYRRYLDSERTPALIKSDIAATLF